jgi:beta-glucanase (GH16 family)
MAIDPNNLAGTAVQTFGDEFNNLSLWNGANGTWDTQYWWNTLDSNGTTLPSNGEQEWYINSNYAPTSAIKPWTVSNGVLNLTAAPAPASIQPLINNYQYTSGFLNSYYSFSQTYGYFEINAKLPSGQGLWPAFWLLPEDGGWPPELDVMEQLGQNPSTIFTTAHSTTLPGGQEAQADAVGDTSNGFHTYGVDWEKDYITWYFDGKPIYKVATPSDMNKPMYMLINLAVGGYWPGSPDGSTQFPATMQVDWVRAYQSLPASASGDGSAGSAPASTPPVTGGTTGSTTSSTPPVSTTPSPTADTLQAVDQATMLAHSAGWTDAKMLPGGELVLGQAQALSWGTLGAADLYHADSGAEVGSPLQLANYAPEGTTLTTQVASLGDGYWKVTYSGSGAPGGYEIYNAAGAQVLVDNAFTKGTPVFAPLDGGGYVLANSATTAFAVVGADGSAAWGQDALVGGKPTAPTSVQALSTGGFVFGYAGSTQLDVYNAAGAHVATTQLGAPMSTWAVASAELPNGHFAEAWLSPPADGGAAFKLTVQTFDAHGGAASAATTVAIDADPWHTQIQVLATGQADQEVVLWSQGGAVWAAFDDAGAVGAPKWLGAGPLSAMTTTVLSNGNIALTWVQSDNGVQDVWAEVVNPTTMSVTQHLLGAGSGGAHVVATANGGFAVSWHAGATIQAVGCHGDGTWGVVGQVSGDFVGADAQGDVVAIGHDPSGAATMQHYHLGVDPLTGAA